MLFKDDLGFFKGRSTAETVEYLGGLCEGSGNGLQGPGPSSGAEGAGCDRPDAGQDAARHRREPLHEASHPHHQPCQPQLSAHCRSSFSDRTLRPVGVQSRTSTSAVGVAVLGFDTPSLQQSPTLPGTHAACERDLFRFAEYILPICLRARAVPYIFSFGCSKRLLASCSTSHPSAKLPGEPNAVMGTPVPTISTWHSMPLVKIRHSHA